MNRIILVGNGFDLAHKLPTKYEDFINWYSQERFRSIAYSDSKISSDMLCSLSLKNKHQFNNLNKTNIPQTNKEMITYNSWHHFFNSTYGEYSGLLDMIADKNNSYDVEFTPLFANIINSIETKGWVDIENEYYNFLRSFLDKPEYKDPKELNDELDFIRAKLTEYLTLVQDKYINENILNKNISKIIFEPINKNDLSIETIKYLKRNHKNGHYTFDKDRNKSKFNLEPEIAPTYICILDFNYTKTADLYLPNSKYFQINHIHGDLEQPENVIFGYGDELDRDYKELSRLNDNEYLRNSKSIKYLESSNYHDVLSFIEFDKFQIYIMGHSCGNSDRTLMNTLFEHENCASIKPFYYQSKDGEDNYLDIVQNISRNFTDMKLMRDRVVNKELCEPLPQNDSTKKQEI
ncbi:hypothetical protein prwr041_04180 [Prevotella herbatica]|uniref:Bacteriophage abortive infection AbiH n=1 Tax=Prevotella herbatica TaxID=2801997 RepID=A0ABN6EF27_9BACT|nr:AbiH family protein [Prevotella herbatica]BCS84525.1 hypothetical protein prwr041_04180 [Prevotella herbatica]